MLMMQMLSYMQHLCMRKGKYFVYKIMWIDVCRSTTPQRRHERKLTVSDAMYCGCVQMLVSLAEGVQGCLVLTAVGSVAFLPY